MVNSKVGETPRLMATKIGLDFPYDEKVSILAQWYIEGEKSLTLEDPRIYLSYFG